MLNHNFKKNKGKHYRKKKETADEIMNRILKKCEKIDCGIFLPPIDAQVALDELAHYLLGENWYSMEMSTKQINTDIVYSIECLYRKRRS